MPISNRRNIMMSETDRNFLLQAANCGSEIARLALDAEAHEVARRYSLLSTDDTVNKPKKKTKRTQQ